MRSIIKEKGKIGQLAEKHGLDMIILFGSFAAGKNRKESDVDIAVRSKKDFFLAMNLYLLGVLIKLFPAK